MKKTLKDKWVAALRSGKYHQTKHVLCKIKGNQTFHCCLGVLCRVAIKGGVQIQQRRTIHSGLPAINFDGNKEELTDNLLNGFDLNEKDAETLAEMNDEGKSFKEIADYIEKEVQ